MLLIFQAHYEKEHERDKQRYENELEAYEKSGQPAPSSKSAQKPQPKVPSKKTISTAKVESDDEDDDQSGEEEEPVPPVKKTGRKKI